MKTISWLLVILFACAQKARAFSPAPEVSPDYAAAGLVLLSGAMVMVFGRRSSK